MLKAKILLVEDSKSQAELTKERLVRSGYEVVWVENGVSAIKSVKTNAPDIVLLDLLLPDMSGTEVCRWIKLSADTKGIPVIMLTVKGSVTDKVSGIEAGADDYLPKPYNDIELNARIYAALRTKALQDELREKNKLLNELLLKVEALAITDPLTGLFNRRHLQSVIESEWQKMKRYGQNLTCFLIDIDDFKSVNDTYGHGAGDSVLLKIARILKEELRETDTIARWGGEEFIAILPDKDGDHGMGATERIREKVANFDFELVPARRITVSIGLAFADSSADSYDRLFNDADAALYEAKRKGKNRVEVAATWQK